jgi:hypothetical protein
LFGIKRDIWALPPEGFGSGPIGSYSFLGAISTIVVAAGLILATSRVRRRELSDELKAGILSLACVTLPPLAIFGSKRFIVPVIPLIALFQGYAIVASVRGLWGDRRIDFLRSARPIIECRSVPIQRPDRRRGSMV